MCTGSDRSLLFCRRVPFWTDLPRKFTAGWLALAAHQVSDARYQRADLESLRKKWTVLADEGNQLQ